MRRQRASAPGAANLLQTLSMVLLLLCRCRLYTAAILNDTAVANLQIRLSCKERNAAAANSKNINKQFFIVNCVYICCYCQCCYLRCYQLSSPEQLQRCHSKTTAGEAKRNSRVNKRAKNAPVVVKVGHSRRFR